MNHRQKDPSYHRLSATYRQAFERLDQALAEHTASDDIEKIDRIRRILFGTENIEAADRSAAQAEKLRQETSS